MCVADDTDPAVKIVRKLQERYPQVPSKLLIGLCTIQYLCYQFNVIIMPF